MLGIIAIGMIESIRVGETTVYDLDERRVGVLSRRIPCAIEAKHYIYLVLFSLHSRTGIIYNVTKSAVGVIINKRVGNRYIEKRVNVRVEHVKHSKCREDFLRRVKEN